MMEKEKTMCNEVLEDNYEKDLFSSLTQTRDVDQFLNHIQDRVRVPALPSTSLPHALHKPMRGTYVDRVRSSYSSHLFSKYGVLSYRD